MPDADLKLALPRIIINVADSPTQQPPHTDNETLLQKHNGSKQNPHSSFTMSGAAQGSTETTKGVTSDSKDTSQPLQPQKPGAQLEEDDEFEDFPVEGMCTRERNLWR